MTSSILAILFLTWLAHPIIISAADIPNTIRYDLIQRKPLQNLAVVFLSQAIDTLFKTRAQKKFTKSIALVLTPGDAFYLLIKKPLASNHVIDLTYLERGSTNITSSTPSSAL
jgi:hypothetical protein